MISVCGMMLPLGRLPLQNRMGQRNKSSSEVKGTEVFMELESLFLRVAGLLSLRVSADAPPLASLCPGFLLSAVLQTPLFGAGAAQAPACSPGAREGLGLQHTFSLVSFYLSCQPTASR